jgi:DNA-binding transcriptional ArsR family regulator
MSLDRRLVVTAGSAELRRRLGSTAWVVFEELLLSSTGDGDGCVASVSVRSLAARLGLSKDTVARALTRLRAAGLVSNCQSRKESGTFATGSYWLTIPTSVAVDDDTPREPSVEPSVTSSAVTSVVTASRVPRSKPSTGDQLAFAIGS